MILIFDLIKQLLIFTKFNLTKISKWFGILFKKNRKLKNISLDYYKNWHLDNSYLIVDLKFKNAIYFKVGKIKSFDFSIPLILNLQNLQTKSIKVEVFGFLQKQVYEIELNKEIKLETKSFKTKFENLSLIEIPRNKAKLKIANFWLSLGKTKVRIQSVSVNTNNITIKSNKFKIQEYI